MLPAVTVFFETFRLTIRKSPSFSLLLAALAAGARTSARMAPTNAARIRTDMAMRTLPRVEVTWRHTLAATNWAAW